MQQLKKKASEETNFRKFKRQYFAPLLPTWSSLEPVAKKSSCCDSVKSTLRYNKHVMAVERAPKRRRINSGKGADLPGFAQVDLEQDYLKRSQKKRKDESNRLLVKKDDGWVEDERIHAVPIAYAEAPEE